MIYLSKKEISIIICFVLLQIGYILSLIGSSQSIDTLISLGVLLIFVSLLINLFISFLYRAIDSKTIFVMSIIIVLGIFSILISGKISIKSFTLLLSFLEIPMFISGTNAIDNVIRKRIVLCFSILIVVYFCVAYKSSRAFIVSTEYGPRIIEDLTLGFSNPNEAAMHLFLPLFILLASFRLHKPPFNLLIFALVVIDLYFIFLTKSRAGIIIAMLSIVIFVFCIKSRKNIPRKYFMIFVFFPIFYLILTIILKNDFGNLIIFGETADTGRIEIYYNRIRGLSFEQVLFGDYVYSFQNSLNSFASILVTTGVFSSLLFFWILYRGLKIYFFNPVNSFSQKISFFLILLVIFHSSFESAVLINGSYYAASFISLFVFYCDGDTEIGRLKNEQNHYSKTHSY